MTPQNWLTIAGMILSAVGGLYWLVRSDINGMMDTKISRLKEDLQNERIKQLLTDNERLQKRVDNTK